MSALAQAWDRRWVIVWAVTIMAAFVVYFAGLSHEAIWYDESVSAAIAGRSAADILRFMPNENHPPLYYLLLHFATRLFGSSEWALRLPSALGAVGLVALGAGPARRVLGDRAALAYAGVVLFMPGILIYAHEARMYSLGTFAVTATVLHGFLAAQEGRRRDWIIFGMASLAAAYLHYYGLIAAALAQACVVLWALVYRREQRKSALLGAGLVLLGYLPWIWVVVGQTARVHRNGFWVPKVSGLGILAVLFRPFAYREIFLSFFPEVRPWMLVALLLSLILVVVGVVLVHKRRAKSERAFALLLLAVYLGTMLVALAISLVATSIFYNRYMMVCAGILALLVAIGIGQLPRAWSVAALAVFALANAPTMKNLYTQHFNLPFRQVLQAMESQIKPGDLVVTSSPASLGPSFYYFPQAVHFYAKNNIKGVSDEVVQVMSPRLHYSDGLKQLLATRRSFWHISDALGIGRDIADILAETPGWQLASEPRRFSGAPASLIDFTVTRYEQVAEPRMRAGYGDLKVHVSGLKPVGNLMVLINDRFPFEPNRLPFRIQTVGVSGEQMDATVSVLPHGDYVLLLIGDENGNYTSDPGEPIWIYNAEQAKQKGFVFDVLKFSFREPERAFEVHIRE